MEKIADYLKNFFRVYTKIMTWTLFATACFITLFWGRKLQLDVGLLWQMQGITVLCTAGSIPIMGDFDGMPKKTALIRMFLNYLYVNGVIMAGGVYFGWFSLSQWKMVLFMLFLIAAGYLIIIIFGLCLANREAERMNRKLAEQEDHHK